MNLFLASPFSQFCEGEEDIIIKNRWFFEKIIKELVEKNKKDHFFRLRKKNSINLDVLKFNNKLK